MPRSTEGGNRKLSRSTGGGDHALLTKLSRWALSVFAILAAATSLTVSCWAVSQTKINDENDDALAGLVETVGHDPNRLLACPYYIGLKYALLHHPAKWAFLPANPKTLSLLMKKYDVGTLIVPGGSTLMRAGQIEKAGFVLDRQVEFKQYHISVYKNTAPPRKQRASALTKPARTPSRTGQGK